MRVDCNGVDLGLWQTWISGRADLEIDQQSRSRITSLQRRRIAAELLADAIDTQARDGRLRDAWQLEVTVLTPTTGSAVGYAERSSRAVPDFHDGDIIRTFATA